ncbi:F-box/WD40 repeat-containing protein [Endozoicomonas sp. 8E]|uniref:F-box/WD repeat-containing protein n=1 Tax=Endozoicomonas sp. 8E TaxID=3035692 RepID=UPI0029394289|nr:F-box/WD40 repeat-containing protein [Endozoicomonas sp. 8E]WOG28273.1 F-box/WD40 repeat-containing protein [Endozoicomonas sp. 8E]
MDPVNSNSGIDLPSPTPGQPQLEEASTVVSAGREVSVYIQNQSPFLCLPYEIKSMIIRYLGFREITRLAKVCRHLRDLVENDKAVARAWYRRFPSPHQYQLKAMIAKKDEQQLRDWLAPFANKDTVESLLKQRESTYFPAQLLFTNSKLMSQCKKFKLVKKTEITHLDQVNAATLSIDGRHLVTASDTTAKIFGQEADGSWELQGTISHNNWVISASFSLDGRHVVTASLDHTAKIYGQEDNGSWKEKAIIPHIEQVTSATFSADGRRLMTVGPDHRVKFFGQGDNGSWELEDTIYHTSQVNSARFSFDESLLAIHDINAVVTIYGKGTVGSWVKKTTLQGIQFAIADISADNCHLVTTNWDGSAKIYSQKASASWQETACISHVRWLTSANFSADCLHVVITSNDNTAKISRLQADGSWQKEASIPHKRRVLSATFSADGRLVVTASEDGTAKVFGLQTDGAWLEKATIRHKKGVLSADFSPDDRYVVTVGNDYSARITELWKDDDDRMRVTRRLPEVSCLLS